MRRFALARAAALLLGGLSLVTIVVAVVVYLRTDEPVPLTARRDTIAKMNIGDVRYASTLALRFDGQGHGWLLPDELVQITAGLHADMRVKRSSDGYHVTLYEDVVYLTQNTIPAKGFLSVVAFDYDGKVVSELPKELESHTIQAMGGSAGAG